MTRALHRRGTVAVTAVLAIAANGVVAQRNALHLGTVRIKPTFGCEAANRDE